jgi:general secretion pathway protein G
VPQRLNVIIALYNAAARFTLKERQQVMQMLSKRVGSAQCVSAQLAGSSPVSAVPRARTRRQRGFTLIEVMVVIAILGILAALIVPKIMSRPDEARRVAAKQDIATVMQALKLYRLDNGRYPTQDQGLTALVKKPDTDPVPNNWKDGGYLERLPNDPWGAPYQYLIPGAHDEIDVFSFGADGKPGGDANNADIGSWQ